MVEVCFVARNIDYRKNMVFAISSASTYYGIGKKGELTVGQSRSCKPRAFSPDMQSSTLREVSKQSTDMKALYMYIRTWVYNFPIAVIQFSPRSVGDCFP